MAIGIAAFLFASAVAALVAPWQQTVGGDGKVIAFVPDQREQGIEATISGVVERWHVQEGSQVRRGDLVVELMDNDANLVGRLSEERSAIGLRLEIQEARVNTLRDRIGSLRRERNAEILSAQAEVDIAQQELSAAGERLIAEQAEQETNDINLRRQRELQQQGLSSQRQFELAELAARQSGAKVASAEASVAAARGKLTSRRAALTRIQASADADIQSAEASLQSAETDVAGTRASLARLDVGISRQAERQVHAPVDGTIQRVLTRQGGEQVSQGEVLAIIVPTTEDRAVELYVDGNDASLVQPGDHVRLQFEGWPAVQFSGWPSVAVGTFGGTVSFVDPAGDGNGNFRVVVVHDDTDEDWPDHRFLRQGVRAKGWFLLNEVSLGAELWRRFNGFPPTTTPPDQGAK